MAAQHWGLGRNLGPRNGMVDALRSRLTSLADRNGPVSLVGWSLGGLYARELAREVPQQVRQVITLGSALYGHPRRTTNAWWTYRLASGFADSVEAEPTRLGDGPPPVPTTSVFSRGDGIVSWRASLEKPAATPVQNIETLGSHLGFGINASVLWLLADRLAQPANPADWQPFAPPRLLRAFYRLH